MDCTYLLHKAIKYNIYWLSHKKIVFSAATASGG